MAEPEDEELRFYEKGSPEGLKEALRRIEEVRKSKVKELDLGGLGLTEIPEQLMELGWLEALYMGLPKKVAHLPESKRHEEDKNKLNWITVLPVEFCTNMHFLMRLDLDNNHIKSLPKEIGNLTALERLDLGNNRLNSLPKEIGSITALKFLLFENNQIKALPKAIGDLPILLWLNFEYNQISALPKEIGNLSNLSNLILKGNKIKALPAEIGSLAALEWLILSNNQIKALPIEIGNLSALNNLQLDDNPLPQSIKDAWDEGGIEALGALLRSLENAAPLYEAKLLVTGEGSVGKSWALAALRGKDPEKEVGKNQTTYGVARGELALPHPDAGEGEIPKETMIDFNCWDFGGQDTYRITHQFFFTAGAIFLLVWNPRDGAEKCRVRQWLRQIELRTGGNAKVIMVASNSPNENKSYTADYGHRNLPKDLQEMIVDEVSIDSKIGDNIDLLRKKIADHAIDLPGMGDEFSTQWKDARDATLKLARNENNPHATITYEEFTGICTHHGIDEDDQIFTLAKVFMHGLGRAVYYGKRHKKAGKRQQPQFDDVQLANIIVLDAEWLTCAFVQVLEDGPTKDAGGILRHSRLDVAWRTHNHNKWKVYKPNEHEYLIRLMREFDVSYVIKGQEGKLSLIAQLLPGEPPDLPWKVPPQQEGNSSIRLICELGSETPGLMERFIVRTHAYHQFDAAEKGMYWRRGVFLRERTYGNEALATIEQTEKPVFTLTISGPQPGWFLGELYNILDDLLNFMPGLDYTLKVACPEIIDGEPCKGDFKFDFLVRRNKTAPDKELFCDVCDCEFTPNKLLTGFAGIEKFSEQDKVFRVQEYSLAKEQTPYPRAFSLTPVDRNKFDPRKWIKDDFAGKKLCLKLYSEHSMKEVFSTEFEVKPGWIKWLGPIAGLTSLALAGAALPMTGDAATQLSEAATFMGGIGGPSSGKGKMDALDADPSGRKRKSAPRWVSGADLTKLGGLFEELGIAPDYGGLEFAKINGKGFMWMTKEEAEEHAEDTPVLSYIPK